MDRGEYQQQQQFLMPPPALQTMQQQRELCVPLMEEQLLMGGRRGGGAASEMRKRRFTEEQIRSLESTFHAHQAKLEPREKAELARELGLQPRQVAIWFQNKRARWRSKQLEHDFAALRAKYDALHSRVESLKQDKLTLTTKLHELSERLREQGGGAATATASSSSCGDGCSEELEVDDKRNIGVEPPESCVLGGCATPADVSVDSECGDHVDYSGGFPESFCATPELWEPWPWPPVEWNAVA
ncbi:homeobox-leucine zipper protein HOX22 [Brachypodium distachyon]|uniref:Homeobox-leucine zipper protein n=1 Tax=Brachypodium distachyon TaxID=15368 RepID=A0A0Q3P4X7_BRADI|nr:homeobox-leucine zipper protein HOX22 [Brachypodium distachyon]KQJ83857.1 hypothetical protein BRADI_5g17170v3 [Brachypodium distachyon]|eukprot:XP_003580250.1 homeobox-leucine zipper protein HOX22 [Brachypodium distachyon]